MPGNRQEERFFNKVEDDMSRIIQREKRLEQFVSSPGQEVNTSTEHEPVSVDVERSTNMISSFYYSHVT